MKNALLLLIVVTLFSCSITRNVYSIDNPLKKIELNEETENLVREYRKKFKKETIVYISYEKKIDSKNNTFYLNRISSLSTVYNYYISYYSVVDGIPVIISSKYDGFVSLDKYTPEFVNLLSSYLFDNMLMAYIKKEKDKPGHWIFEQHFNDLIIDHSEVWKIKNWKVIENWKKHPGEEKVMIENEDYNSMDYYRVIEGGIDER